MVRPGMVRPGISSAARDLKPPGMSFLPALEMTKSVDMMQAVAIALAIEMTQASAVIVRGAVRRSRRIHRLQSRSR